MRPTMSECTSSVRLALFARSCVRALHVASHSRRSVRRMSAPRQCACGATGHVSAYSCSQDCPQGLQQL